MIGWRDAGPQQGYAAQRCSPPAKVSAAQADSRWMANDDLHLLLAELNTGAKDLEYRLSVLLSMAESGSVAMMPRAAGEVMSSSAALAAPQERLARVVDALARRTGAPASTPLRELARMLGNEGAEVLDDAEELASSLDAIARLRDSLSRVCAERIERLHQSMALFGVRQPTTYSSTGKLSRNLAPIMSEAV